MPTTGQKKITTKRRPRTLTAAKGGAEPSLRQLGRVTETPLSPEAAVLETVPNPQPGVLYLARFTAPEFTSLCPVTGQPDFAHLVIDYAPAKKIIESKSLKLFLTSFRNHGAFHEDCTVKIGRRLVRAGQAKALRRLRPAKRGQLREHEPHPMARLGSSGQLRADLIIDPVLGIDEALKVKSSHAQW